MLAKRNYPRSWPFGNRRGWAALLCLAALAWANLAGAAAPPQNPSPFDMTGFIQAATLDPTCATNVLCGGTITVNNQLITVPKNTILQMPALALTWQQVFANAPAAYLALGQSGLALSDGNLTAVPPGTVPPPLGTYEVHVQGNRVGDTYVAGLIFLAQSSLQSSQGFINFIDLTTGFFEVGGTIGVAGTGQRVTINDPAGKFARSTLTTQDTRFTLDANNPTVRSATGFPMCLPRGAGDALCPQTNRPLDPTALPPLSPFQMILTMPAVASVVAGGPDPRIMAPFEVGDYVTYSGILVADPAPAITTYIAAYQVIGNVGLYTAPGDVLAYVANDVMLLGTGGAIVAGAAEATVRTRVEGFTSDPSRNILLYGIDVDACTGAQTPRLWGSIGVDQGAAAGGAVLGRWRFRPPCTAVGSPTDKACLITPAGTFLPPTREMRATIETVKGSAIPSPPFATTSGLNANMYQAPIFDFLFPENAGIGTPVVPLNFDTMPFLTQGSGPLDPTQPASATNPVVGQLNLWPGLPIPTAVSCAVAGVPSANPGPAQTVGSGALVTLTGTGLDGGAPPLTFAWTQTAGAVMALTQNATTGIATFTAPLVQPGAATVLTFQLIVTNAAGVASAPAFVTITVNPVATDVVSISLVEYRRSNQRLTVNAGSTASTAVPPASLTVQAFDAAGLPQGGPQPMVLQGGIYITILAGVPQPTSVKVVSDHGGTATSGITRLR